MKTTSIFLLLFLFIGIKICAQKTNTKPVVSINDGVCGDILHIYTQKHSKVKFIKCTEIKDSQVIVEALYQFKGANVDEVEKYFKKKYQTSQLKYTCCGWETSHYGSFENNELKEKGYSIIISIYSGETLEIVKKAVPYFYVKVSIIIC